MMNIAKRISLLLCCLVLLFSSALADDSNNMNHDGFSTSYTYGYDYWGDVMASPDAYRVTGIVNSVNLGLEAQSGLGFSKPQSLFVRGDDLYIADTYNNRIVQVRMEGGSCTLTRVIDSLKGCEPATFNMPYDMYVDEDNNLYVADWGNHRVVMADPDLNFVKEFVKPQDATFDQNNDFLPKKLTVDPAGRVYVLATNVNKGLVKFEADTVFTGFIGANEVTVSLGEYMWKRYFQTQAQREASASFVPTEYENLYMDPEGFIYATTTSFSEYDLKWDNAKPIRRLNSLGKDILIKNDRYPPIGDLYWVEGDTTYYGPSRMTDITVFDNEIYVTLDRSRGRLFGYDNQGVMLWAFGTRGNVDGAFTGAVSLEHHGTDLLVLDALKNNITVFSVTEYGQRIYDAIGSYQKGHYEESADIWQQVLRQNANYSLAFRGIGRAMLRQDRFEEAMDFFKMAHDRENYGRAFKLYRKVWVEQNIWWIVLILAVILIVPLVIGKVKKAKWEVIMYEQNKVHREN